MEPVLVRSEYPRSVRMHEIVRGQIRAVIMLGFANVELEAHQPKHLVQDVFLNIGVAELLLDPG